jgi:hypothetical protein
MGVLPEKQGEPPKPRPNDGILSDYSVVGDFKPLRYSVVNAAPAL